MLLGATRAVRLCGCLIVVDHGVRCLGLTLNGKARGVSRTLTFPTPYGLIWRHHNRSSSSNASRRERQYLNWQSLDSRRCSHSLDLPVRVRSWSHSHSADTVLHRHPPPHSDFSSGPDSNLAIYQIVSNVPYHDSTTEIMLKPLSQHRQSPASSPHFHYAPASQPSPSTSSSRRPSRSTPPALKPISKPSTVAQYADAGTQWSPRMNPRTGPTEPQGALPLGTSQRPEPPLPTLATSAPSLNLKTVMDKESPGMKRRQTGAEQSIASAGAPVSAPTSQEEEGLPSKRAKSDRGPLKMLPAKYEFCEVQDMVVLIADMISDLIQTNDALPIRSGILTRFHSRTPPGISVFDYLSRLAKHATLTPPLLLSMVYYMDKLCSQYPAFTVNTLTVHRFLITAATVAAKGLSDSFWNNATYARVGGIKVAELGMLELDFLYRLDWRIVPRQETLIDYYQGLIERIEGYELKPQNTVAPHTTQEDENESVAPKDPGIKLEDATDEKWKEWMQDVSAQSAEEKEPRES